jgi:hypothetical protein
MWAWSLPMCLAGVPFQVCTTTWSSRERNQTGRNAVVTM